MHPACHALLPPELCTLGITQVGFSLAQACLFRVMREPQQSKAPPPATGAPPCLHVSPCASIVVALMTCSRALSPGGASSPAPFLLAGPAFASVLLWVPCTRCAQNSCPGLESNTHMHFIHMNPERMHIWNAPPNHLPPQFEGQDASAVAGRLRRRPYKIDCGRRSSSFSPGIALAGRTVPWFDRCA